MGSDWQVLTDFIAEGILGSNPGGKSGPKVDENLSYEEKPLEIIDRREKVLRNQTIPLVKVLWTNHGSEEATWEKESDMRNRYPHLF